MDTLAVLLGASGPKKIMVGCVIVTVPRRNKRTDVDYIVEVSPDLGTWNSGAGHTVIMQETGGKVVFVFHGKEQLAFANKNELEYSDVMTKLSELKKQGVEFRFCNNAMKGNGLVPADMNGLVTVIPAGYPELALLQSQGYKYLFFSYY